MVLMDYVIKKITLNLMAKLYKHPKYNLINFNSFHWTFCLIIRFFMILNALIMQFIIKFNMINFCQH